MKRRLKTIMTRIVKCFDRITKFLEKYRVWFETVMCVSLSICAIVVSIQANKISEQQYLYDKTQNSPFFVVDSYVNQTSDDVYVVDNTGGEVRQCYIYVNHYICGDFGPTNSPDDKEVYLIAKDLNQQEEYLLEKKYLPFEFSLPTINGDLVSSAMNNEMRLMDNSIVFYQFAIVTLNYTDSENIESTEYFFVYNGNVQKFTEAQMSDLDYHYWGYFDVDKSNFLEDILNWIID